MDILRGTRLAKNGVHSVDLKKKYLATNNRVVSRYDKNYESGNGLADFFYVELGPGEEWGVGARRCQDKERA